MTAQLKNFFTIFLKNAVNAILTNGAMMVALSGAFNVSTKTGWWNIAKLTFSTVAAREAAVWLPILLKWSGTSANPAVQRTVDGGLIVPPPKASIDAEKP